MTMEQSKTARIERKEYINQYLRKLYKADVINGTECFFLPSGTIIHLESMGDEFNAIVVGYADNLAEAKNNRFEDGDLFYMDELNEEDMLKAIIKEIEDE